MSLEDFPRHFADRFPELVGGRLLVALSGGPDSVALLHLLADPSLGLELEAAHVHHVARRAEADRDAEFCRALCERRGVPFHLLRLAPEPAPREGREAAWRHRRYRALLEVVAQRSLDAVATAHHRDDVAEGVIMQLLRGAGPRALAGIAAATDAGVIRPLLPWRRLEIVDWLQRRGIPWIEDSSNADLGHLRNRVRHVVLPELRSSSPRIDDHLVHLADALAADEALFADSLERAALWISPWAPVGGVPVDDLRALARPLRSRWLHAQAARAGIGRVTRRQTALLHRLVEASVPRSVTLADRWRLLLARGRLWLEPPVAPQPYQHRLEVGSLTALSIPGWRVRLTLDGSPSPQARWHWRTSPSTPLTVRSPQPGDAVEVAGTRLGVPRLIARVAPRHLRSAWPLLCENARIAWIPGVWQGTSTGALLVEVLTDG
ncbi:MAG: tRNA lysidine(34) synthetase TilS [Holophagae bacterium]|nr:MAG: tRNA lysidine(34) synthetase TilS [Holophagae bacterium]